LGYPHRGSGHLCSEGFQGLVLSFNFIFLTGKKENKGDKKKILKTERSHSSKYINKLTKISLNQYKKQKNGPEMKKKYPFQKTVKSLEKSKSKQLVLLASTLSFYYKGLKV
jgi:hypothetical protein